MNITHHTPPCAPYSNGISRFFRRFYDRLQAEIAAGQEAPPAPTCYSNRHRKAEYTGSDITIYVNKAKDPQQRFTWRKCWWGSAVNTEEAAHAWVDEAVIMF